ncbi:endonuclease III [Francisella orientalis]|uniref:Endonuclease III n=1 Tax=Francisella orientalis TaxID=299583 RepID=A0AAP7C5V3_9GAMM|nr:endonuclease III [Francisella orientalis]AFJ43753.1 DNA-(apurinic or apyrimidinic site) lyase [Francisella orientalis str. Toba 04]AHB98304.1 endonuclease III [Francisella orientalis LADL 07-285A]AKN85454.1 Endonuclease III [Francisella orientalis FNO12]AKN86993.1 Endonuclease III [Francisella orientalis FNO24]AKN88531.1 Endonuclease III [Francisella orientalis]
MNRQKRIQIFETWKKNNPNPTTELEYSSNFELLIAVILSAQATDVSVNKATQILYKIANTPETIYVLGEQKLAQYIKSIGLYETKAKNVIATCKDLIEKFDSQVPDNFDDLISLAGVGRKTANVVLNTVFNQPTMAVDTHIFRLANRIPLAKGKNVNEVEKKLLRVIPKEYLQDAHHWIILHGRYICTAQKPKCRNCIIFQYCEFKDKEKYL